MTHKREKVRLNSENDGLHDEQEGRVNVYVLTLLSRPEIQGTKNGCRSDSEIGRKGCASCTGAAGAQNERREETVGALKEIEVEYFLKRAYYHHVMAAMPNNVIYASERREKWNWT